MIAKLSKELHQALSAHSREPILVEDPVTHTRYVLVQLDLYEQWQRVMTHNTSSIETQEFIVAFKNAMKNDRDAPAK